ncbi:MAG: DUF1638 domain-containing protein [Desulfitobacterium hafniense]|nr:DUF1638 domain-containing protein [Desulfitobacterium hafniense]
MEGKVLVLSCNVLKPQIELIGDPNFHYEYLKQGLHRTPELLRDEIQKSIEKAGEYDYILLGYGLCSRAVIGLKAKEHQTLVIPKIDDCIGISMGSREKYYEVFAQNPGTYYFTKGWTEADNDPLKEYHLSVEKYGEEMALWVAHESLKHYTRTVLIHTENEELDSVKEYVQDFAKFFNLRYEEMDGSLDYLQRLLFGPWNQDFVVIKNGETVDDSMFR